MEKTVTGISSATFNSKASAKRSPRREIKNAPMFNKECMYNSTKMKGGIVSSCVNEKVVWYDEKAQIGEGGFGVVRPITIMIDGREIDAVIKIIRENVFSLKQEIRAVRDFNSEVDHSVHMGMRKIGPEVYDAFYVVYDDAVTQYIIMEKFHYTVYQWAKSSHYPRGAQQVAGEMLSLLYDKIYRANMYCSDIKPQNYVLKYDRSGRLKIRMIDFGHDWCSREVPSIYTSYPALRVYSRLKHKEMFFAVCAMQLFTFLFTLFDDIEDAKKLLIHFEKNKLFREYIIEGGVSKNVNMRLVLHDVLETNKEQAEIFLHYMEDVYSPTSETLTHQLFKNVELIWPAK